MFPGIGARVSGALQFRATATRVQPTFFVFHFPSPFLLFPAPPSATAVTSFIKVNCSERKKKTGRKETEAERRNNNSAEEERGSG